MLAATRKRHAHRLSNETATSVENEQVKSVQNEGVEQSAIAKWIVLPERGVTVHSEDMGYTIGLFAGERNALEGV